ncbi:MAG: hypothetical protein CM1200mP34_5850 [Verrucomicrobiales bacterium]|nr:MAG: hypothetical protein CM1200mP34_5850 [Verrucomicrobiales bacterium]
MLPGMQLEFPGTYWSFEGEKSEQAETLASLQYLYIVALIIIYALLAIPFNSYIQPLIVMAAIPFGLIGAVWGHVVMGMEVTILSGFGVVALTGVVVNDSLVMVDYVNRKRGIGLSEMESARQAGLARFRPILLTSLTTFAGLTPAAREKFAGQVPRADGHLAWLRGHLCHRHHADPRAVDVPHPRGYPHFLPRSGGQALILPLGQALGLGQEGRYPPP